MTENAIAVNARQVGYSDLAGRGDALQVCGQKRGDRYYLYVGHFWSLGISILDVTDPAHPEIIRYLPSPTPNTWHINLQVGDDLLMVANERIIPGWGTLPPDSPFEAGVQLYDVRDPHSPRRLGAWKTSGSGTHRNWYAGGRYAYLAASEDGFEGRFLVILDVADPEHPVEAGRWWIPGQGVKHGEKPWWPTEHRVGHYTLHGVIPSGDRVYLAYEDFGIRILDAADPARPVLQGERNLHPPFAGYSHTTLPLPERNLLVVAEETILYNCQEQQKRIWMMDVREPGNPVPISTLPLPTEPSGEPKWCEKGGRFGPHNLHENRPGGFQSDTLLFNAFFNAGLRVWDVRDPFVPVEVASFIPPAPAHMVDPRPNAPRTISSQDVYVDDRGYCFLTDYNAGLYVVALTGEAGALMHLPSAAR
ncbi:MAG: hypothetical protein HYX52_00235 [Chloroflexi bacterium]|nr:hypothetical protein [Chloroflexota bacterium]